MEIQKGMRVQTLSGTIVKTENQIEPGYWACNDGRTHLAASLRPVTDDAHLQQTELEANQQVTKH